MNSIKYCPNCQKENPVDQKTCSCGYEFVVKEVVDETVSTNTTIIVDNVPSFVWKIVSFFCPIAGLVLYFKFKENFPERSRICKKTSIGTLIFIGVSIIIIIAIIIGFLTGDIV